MMYKLIKRQTDKGVRYFWRDEDGVNYGDDLLSPDDAEVFFIENLQECYPGEDRRKKDFDRRWHLNDRRKRNSLWDRRERPAGRRWTDELEFERRNLKILNGN